MFYLLRDNLAFMVNRDRVFKWIGIILLYKTQDIFLFFFLKSLSYHIRDTGWPILHKVAQYFTDTFPDIRSDLFKYQD